MHAALALMGLRMGGSGNRIGNTFHPAPLPHILLHAAPSVQCWRGWALPWTSCWRTKTSCCVCWRWEHGRRADEGLPLSQPQLWPVSVGYQHCLPYTRTWERAATVVCTALPFRW